MAVNFTPGPTVPVCTVLHHRSDGPRLHRWERGLAVFKRSDRIPHISLQYEGYSLLNAFTEVPNAAFKL